MGTAIITAFSVAAYILLRLIWVFWVKRLMVRLVLALVVSPVVAVGWAGGHGAVPVPIGYILMFYPRSIVQKEIWSPLLLTALSVGLLEVMLTLADRRKPGARNAK